MVIGGVFVIRRVEERIIQRRVRCFFVWTPSSKRSAMRDWDEKRSFLNCPDEGKPANRSFVAERSHGTKIAKLERK